MKTHTHTHTSICVGDMSQKKNRSMKKVFKLNRHHETTLVVLGLIFVSLFRYRQVDFTTVQVLLWKKEVFRYLFHLFITNCPEKPSQNILQKKIFWVDSSFSGERSDAHHTQEVGSQTPRRVVVRLSKCSNVNICS